MLGVPLLGAVRWCLFLAACALALGRAGTLGITFTLRVAALLGPFDRAAPLTLGRALTLPIRLLRLRLAGASTRAGPSARGPRSGWLRGVFISRGPAPPGLGAWMAAGLPAARSRVCSPARPFTTSRALRQCGAGASGKNSHDRRNKNSSHTVTPCGVTLLWQRQAGGDVPAMRHLPHREILGF